MSVPLNEKQLQDAVLELAGVLGWRRAHFRPARTKNGWRTPVEGDGKGFPDLILLRGPRMIVAELKSGSGYVSADQREWINAFGEVAKAASGALEGWLWTPAQWDDGTIEAVLR